MDSRVHQDHQCSNPGQSFVQVEQRFWLAEADDLAFAHRVEKRRQDQNGARYAEPAPDPDQVEPMQQCIDDNCRQQQRSEHQQKRENFFADK